MSDWPHDEIHRVALGYIRKDVPTGAQWRFTRLDALPERLARIAPLQPEERSIVSFFIDAQRWYVMTTARIFGLAQGSPFDCSPLDVAQWRWGDSKHASRSGVELATLAMKTGMHLRISYEAGPAAMAPIRYGEFWETQYPGLEALK